MVFGVKIQKKFFVNDKTSAHRDFVYLYMVLLARFYNVFFYFFYAMLSLFQIVVDHHIFFLVFSSFNDY